MNALTRSTVVLLIAGLLALSMGVLPAAAAENDRHDVVIVGGNLSALAAAYELRGRRVLILAQGDHLGAPAQSAATDRGLVYERGCLFGIPPREAPFRIEPGGGFSNSALLGLLHKGELILGETIDALLEQVSFTAGERSGIEEHAGVLHHAAFDLPAFFHPAGGNGGLAERYRQSIDARVITGAAVTEVRDLGNTVTVAFFDGETQHTVTAGAAIVSLPPAKAAPILAGAGRAVLDLLNSYTVGRRIMVTIGFTKASFPEFSRVLVPAADDASTHAAVVVQRSRPQNQEIVMQIAFTDRASRAMENLPDEAVTGAAMAVLGRLGAHSEKAVSFTEIIRDGLDRPIVSQDLLDARAGKPLQPSERVFLAGACYAEYIRPLTAMTAAIRAGRKTAHRVRRLLWSPKRYPVDALVIMAAAGQETMNFITRLGAPLLGTAGDTDSVQWLRKMKTADATDYRFKTIFAGLEMDPLLKTSPAELDIICYCPVQEKLIPGQLNERLKILERRFTEAELLLVVNPGQIEAAVAATPKPDLLGVAVTTGQFDQYLSGAYDKLVSMAREAYPDLYFIFAIGYDTDRLKLEKVQEKAAGQGLKLGYGLTPNHTFLEYLISNLP